MLPNPNGPLRTAFCAFIGALFVFGANASVIDIIQQADGTFEIFSDGARYGGASTRAMAEKVAQKLGAGGNTINWSSASVNTGGAGAGVGGGASGTTSATTGYSTNTTVNAKGTTSTKFTTGGKEYVYEQTATGKTAFKDATTGRYTSRPNMPPATTSQTGSNLPATTAKPGSNLPATTTKSGSNLPATSPKALPPHNDGTPPNPPKPAPSAPKVNVAGAALGVAGMVAGAVGMYESVKSKDTKATWADVGTGAMSGMTFAAGTAAVVNAIPVGGQIAYGATVAVGTVIGAAGAGAKMFSETDCEMDPVTGQYACCNVSKLTNIQARLVNIGDEMFGTFPYVRTCMQGKNKFESDWFTARFLDDHWSKEGEVKFCSGYQMPENGDYNIQAYGSSEAEGKVCWQWECADAGFVRSGAKCVSQATDNVLDEVVIVANAIKAGDPCPNDRLPQYATAGKYIKNGKNKETGLDKFVCAATECKDGTYLVKNEQGVSQGWCKAGVAPDMVATTDISDDTVADDVPENTTDSSDDTMTDDTPEQAQPIVPVAQKTPCESGTPGCFLFEGTRITDTQHNQILADRQATKVRELTRQIDHATSQLDAITSGFKISVWKDKDGKFNTARLASDSIAGVVLGTTGGLITSSIVKKNQVENGFEDIKCVIGGQSVANWGDQFRVGIQ